MSRTVRSMADFRRLITAGREPEHHFVRRLIECACGRTFEPDKFDAHLIRERLAAFRPDWPVDHEYHDG